MTGIRSPRLTAAGLPGHDVASCCGSASLKAAFPGSLGTVARFAHHAARATRQDHGREFYTAEDIRKIVALPADSLTMQRNQAAVAFLFLSGMRVGAFVTLSLRS